MEALLSHTCDELLVRSEFGRFSIFDVINRFDRMKNHTSSLGVEGPAKKERRGWLMDIKLRK